MPPSTKSRLVSAHNVKRWALRRESEARKKFARHKKAYSDSRPMRDDESLLFQGEQRRQEPRSCGSRPDKHITNVGIITAGCVVSDASSMKGSGLDRVSVWRAKAVVLSCCMDKSSDSLREKLTETSDAKIIKHSFDGSPANVRDDDGSVVRRPAILVSLGPPRSSEGLSRVPG